MMTDENEEINASQQYHRYQETDYTHIGKDNNNENNSSNNNNNVNESLPLHYNNNNETVKDNIGTTTSVTTTSACRSSHNNSINNNNENAPPTDWIITDIGHNIGGEYSRDGSIHVTDEVFNTGSHLVGTLLSILGTSLLITDASVLGQPWKIVSFSIYGTSLIFLFGCSTLHHGITTSVYYEMTFRMLDYLAIYPLIAGTFTPLCLVLYHDNYIGWVFFGTVWGIALFGCIMTSLFFTRIPKWLSMTMYITLGWLGACMTYWLIPKLTLYGFSLFIVGGIFYTIGGYIVSYYYY